MIFGVLPILFFGLAADAQVVTQVQDKKVLIDLRGTNLEINEEIAFYTSDLNEAGRGRVLKMTPQKSLATAELIAGHAEVGMHIESLTPRKKNYTPTESDLRTMREPLSKRDQRILERGEITKTQYVVGGILGTYPIGFGVGHAIQKRYQETGWIFTVGELGSLAVAAAGASTCMEDNYEKNKWSKCNSGIVFAGVMGFVGFRIWEIIDLWATPPKLNRRYRQLSESRTEALILPQTDGGQVGLRWRF